MEVLYLKSQGLSHPDIRRLCRIRSKTTLVTYLREYEAGGIEALKQLNFKGSPSELIGHRESLKAHFEAHPPRTSAEAQAEIERLTGIKRSPTQIKAFLKRIGMKPRKVGYVPGKAATPEKMAEQDTFQPEELEPRLAEAQAGERALFLWMRPTLSTALTWVFSGASPASL
jgi:transposase